MIRIQIDGEAVATSGIAAPVTLDAYQASNIGLNTAFRQETIDNVAELLLFSTTVTPTPSWRVMARNVSTGGQSIGFGSTLAVTIATAGFVLYPGEWFVFEGINDQLTAIASANGALLDLFIMRTA